MAKIIPAHYKKMNSIPERPIFSKNTELAQLGDRLSDILQGNKNEIHQIKNIRIAVDIIEKSGCSTDIFCKFLEKEDVHSKNIEILFLDLNWISPGSLGGWSENGQQACYCITKKSKTNWYKTILQQYFNTQNQRSLLSYRDIFTRPEFLKVHYLDKNTTEKINSKKQSLISKFSNEAWQDSFKPDPLSSQSTEEWTERFELYSSLIQKGLIEEFDEEFIENTRLAWVYVSSGVDKIGDEVPLWSASMFILYKLKHPNQNNIYEDLLLSNLLHYLKVATYQTLERGHVRRYFAQALSHEYKNLNQDVAALSEKMMDCFRDIHPLKREELQITDFYNQIQALHFASQATTAMSKAAYWLASPSLTSIYFSKHRAGEIFQHILFLAIQLIVITGKDWKLIDIPTLDETVKLINQDLGLNARKPTDLLSNLCVQIMLFFALEPVRNIRKSGLSPVEVSVNIDSNRNIIKLNQKLSVKEVDSSYMRSKSISALMQTLEDSNYKLKPFIKIDPDVKSRIIKKESESIFIIERTTTIEVYQIPIPK